MKTSPLDKHSNRSIFHDKVKIWSDNAAANEFPDWEEQIRLLSEIGDLITPDLAVEEVIAVIYSSVNQLMDAYQFGVGLYNEEEAIIHFKGLMENNKQFPELIVDVYEENRFAPWCILHESEIFINDMEAEYSRYVKNIPYPKVGTLPKAALYVPLRMNNKIAGLIMVRTPHKNVYHNHHLHILKTLGNFVIRSLALAREKNNAPVKNEAGQKQWHWNTPAQLPLKSGKLLSQLTEREKEVLFLMVSGISNKSIAEKLFISSGTIKTHTLNIYRKIDVANRTSAIMKAIELNWFV